MIVRIDPNGAESPITDAEIARAAGVIEKALMRSSVLREIGVPFAVVIPRNDSCFRVNSNCISKQTEIELPVESHLLMISPNTEPGDFVFRRPDRGKRLRPVLIEADCEGGIAENIRFTLADPYATSKIVTENKGSPIHE